MHFEKILTILTILPILSFANPVLVIKAHTRTLALNTLHQNQCTQIGGVDITDDSDITVGPNTLDAFFCKIVDENKYNSMRNYVSVGTFNPDGTLLMIDNSVSEKNVTSNALLGAPDVSNPSWQAYAGNGTVNAYEIWYVQGMGVWNNIENSYIKINIYVPTFGCSSTISENNFTGSTSITATVACAASNPGYTYDYATAYLNGASVQTRGTVYFK